MSFDEYHQLINDLIKKQQNKFESQTETKNHLIYFLLFYFILSINLAVSFCTSWLDISFLVVLLFGDRLILGTDFVILKSIARASGFNL